MVLVAQYYSGNWKGKVKINDGTCVYEVTTINQPTDLRNLISALILRLSPLLETTIFDETIEQFVTRHRVMTPLSFISLITLT